MPGLKKNNDGTFTMDGKFYPLKASLPEEMYLVKLPTEFWDTPRDNNMNVSINTDDKSKTNN